MGWSFCKFLVLWPPFFFLTMVNTVIIVCVGSCLNSCFLFVWTCNWKKYTLFNLGGILKDFCSLSLVSFKIVVREGVLKERVSKKMGDGKMKSPRSVPQWILILAAHAIPQATIQLMVTYFERTCLKENLGTCITKHVHQTPYSIWALCYSTHAPCSLCAGQSQALSRIH